MNEKVNLNSATLQQLQKIVHIGKVRANLIIEQRKKERFKDVYELSVIPGLGKYRMSDVIDQNIAAV